MARTKGLTRHNSQRLQRAIKLKPKESQPNSTSSKFYCEQCEKWYASISSFNVHCKKHDGRRWKCDLCDEVFVSKYVYVRHLNRAHNLRQVQEHADNANEVEVYIDEDETVQLTHNAKDIIIKKLTEKLARKTKIIRGMREQILNLKEQLKMKVTDVHETDSGSSDESQNKS